MIKEELNQILFPSRCMSCSALGPSICSRCRSSWNPHIYRRTYDGLHIYSSIRYSPTAQKIILGAKESGFHDCDLLVIEALKKSLTYFRRERGVGILIPIPSRSDARRRRGRDFISELTAHLDLPSESALTLSKKVRDHSRLSHEERGRNIAGAMRVCTRDVSEVILVDDVVTSGSTLLEARRAFQRRGIPVKGAITAVMA